MDIKKVMPISRHPKKAKQEVIETSKKINSMAKRLRSVYSDKMIRIMFQDEAGFGRISKPKYCWCTKEVRPEVPCHHIREYKYAYVNMNVFLEYLSKQYEEDIILLICDGAVWHKSKGLDIPKNIKIEHIPPYTPEMNPTEQIWRQIRSMGFKNEVFRTLKDVIDRLCDTINLLTKDMVKSITHRSWIE